jgi:hypothetical protein
VHQQQLAYFLDVALREVYKEQHTMERTFTDYVDDAVESDRMAKQFQTCAKCNLVLEKTKRKCTACGVNLKEARKAKEAPGEGSQREEEVATELEEISMDTDVSGKKGHERYNHITSNHPDQPPKIIIADPIFCNPNSYDSITLILRRIGQDAGIHRYGGDKRHWTYVCCDGLPYNLALKVIEQTFICASCDKSIFGKEEIRKHERICTDDASEQHGRYYREFDWVVLRTGDGHVEMNMMKSFMELNWDVFMSDMCRVLSFQSLLAQASAKRCDDTHKTWAILIAFHLATLKELVLPYVRDCISIDSQPNPGDFHRYANERRHIPNYYYLYE